MSRTASVHVIVLTFALLVPSAVARAGDREFDSVVDYIRKTHDARKRGSVSLGFARFLVKVAKPAGIKSVRVTILEQLSGDVDGASLGSAVRNALGSDWQPFIRVYSRSAGEHAFVYARPKDGDMEFFVVAVDGREATVVKTRIDLEHVVDWLTDQDFVH